MLGTVKKAGEVISLFTKQQPELGVTEVAEALHIPKSSAYALLASLCEIALLRRTPQNRYRLGWRILGLGSILKETTEFRVEAVPAMQRLVARFGETVHLAVLEGFHVVYVEKLEGTRAVRIAASSVGARLPAHCSGVGKVLLANRPWKEIEELATQHGLPPYTPHTITRPEQLRAELDRVREQGFAYDLEEVSPELCCVAAPVRDFSGRTVAAMSLSVPSYRFRQNRDVFRMEILRAAREVSENVGYISPPCKGKRPQGGCAKEG